MHGSRSVDDGADEQVAEDADHKDNGLEERAHDGIVERVVLGVAAGCDVTTVYAAAVAGGGIGGVGKHAALVVVLYSGNIGPHGH